MRDESPMKRRIRTERFEMLASRESSPALRLKQTSAEPLACSVRQMMRRAAKNEHLVLRDSDRAPARRLALPSWPAISSGSVARADLLPAITRTCRCTPRVKTANQALQPTRMLVTFRAYARPAPSTRVADLWRWAVSRWNRQCVSSSRSAAPKGRCTIWKSDGRIKVAQ